MATAGTVVMLALLVIWLRGRPDGRLHVAFLDVGQGDAILIQSPSGRQLLVDGGELWYARLTTHDNRVLVARAGNSFSTFTPSGGSQGTLRGAGGDALSADVK